MTDDPHRAKEPPPKRIGAWIVTAGLLCVAGSIFYGFREYAERSRDQVIAIDAQTAEMKSQALQRLYEGRRATYLRVTEAASRIAALKASDAPPAQLQEAVTQFKTLFLGPASATEGADFNQAVVIFNGGLDAGADAGQLAQLSLDFARVCANEARDPSPAGDAARDSVHDSNAAILAQMREIVRVPEAQHAAAQWLALLDAAQYDDAYKFASAYFQSTVPQKRWEDLRKLLGSVLSRKPAGTEYSASVRSAPDGDYMVMQFDTSFAQKNNTVETVTTMLDKDG